MPQSNTGSSLTDDIELHAGQCGERGALCQMTQILADEGVGGLGQFAVARRVGETANSCTNRMFNYH